MLNSKALANTITLGRNCLLRCCYTYTRRSLGRCIHMDLLFGRPGWKCSGGGKDGTNCVIRVKNAVATPTVAKS